MDTTQKYAGRCTVLFHRSRLQLSSHCEKIIVFKKLPIPPLDASTYPPHKKAVATRIIPISQFSGNQQSLPYLEFLSRPFQCQTQSLLALHIGNRCGSICMTITVFVIGTLGEYTDKACMQRQSVVHSQGIRRECGRNVRNRHPSFLRLLLVGDGTKKHVNNPICKILR